MPYSVLVVDDEDLTLRTISRGLRDEGFDVYTANSGEEAVRVFEDEKPNLTLLDIVMPGINDVNVLRQIKLSTPAAIVLMMSAYHMVDRAVDAMKLGAYDYLIKPFHLADMIATLHRASEMLALRVRVRDNVEQAKGRYDFGRIVTENPDTRRMLEVARKAAESDHTTILIQGESGTGKGVLAKAIHYASPRAAMPLVELNCAALPDSLLETDRVNRNHRSHQGDGLSRRRSARRPSASALPARPRRQGDRRPRYGRTRILTITAITWSTLTRPMTTWER